MVQREAVDCLVDLRNGDVAPEELVAVYWVPDATVMRLIEVSDSPYSTILVNHGPMGGLPPVSILCLTTAQFEALKAEDAATFSQLTDRRFTPVWPELGGAKIFDIRGFTQVWPRGP